MKKYRNSIVTKFITSMLVIMLVLSNAIPARGFERKANEFDSKLNSLVQAMARTGKISSLDLFDGYTQQIPVLLKLNQTPTASGETLGELVPGDVASIKQRENYHNQKIDEFINKLSNYGIALTNSKRLNLISPVISTSLTVDQLKFVASFDEVESVSANFRTYDKPQGVETPIKPRSRRTRRSVFNVENVKGQGKLVAILDTGFQPEHASMTISDETFNESAMFKSEVELQDVIDKKREVNSFALPGKWYNRKVVYGYNYADYNDKIEETGESHGTHVAGISVGNDPTTGFKGQAPEAQVALMRVFGANNKGTESYIYNSAIEDAIRLGATSINMSLGSDAGILFTLDKVTTAAIDKAKSMGIVVVIAAGNSGYTNSDTTNPMVPPRADNPDYSMVGNPAIEINSLAVASYNSDKIYTRTFDIVGTNQFFSYTESGSAETKASIENRELFDKELDVVDVGLGGVASDIDASTNEEYGIDDFAGKDLTGKIALIKRGKFTFVNKLKNAANHGAVMAIVYNHIPGTIGMQLDSTVTIPSVALEGNLGLKLVEYLTANPGSKVVFRKAKKELDNPVRMQVSDFSSWGPSVEFDLKPEIMAVGGNVNSSLPVHDGNEGYGEMSGTSMATPQVAGAVAKLDQRLDSDPAIVESTKEQRYYLLKNILMSTANPVAVSITDSNFVSPRKQGAGLMDIESALRTKAYLKAANSEVAKINLGSINGGQFDLNFDVVNMSKNDELSFTPKVYVQTDKVIDVDEGLIDILKVDLLSNFSDSQFNVAANSHVQKSISVDITSRLDELYSRFKNGFYVEGFVVLESNTPQQPSISIPFIAYHTKKDDPNGSYIDIPVLEKSVYDFKTLDPNTVKESELPLFYRLDTREPKEAMTYLFTNYDSKELILGEVEGNGEVRNFDKEKIAFSPNGDNKADFIQLNGVFLRPHYKHRVIVKNSKGEIDYSTEFSSVNPENVKAKNYYKQPSEGQDPSAPLIYLNSTERAWSWDGFNFNNLSKQYVEGKYTFEFHVSPGVEGSKEQVYSFPVILDITKPKLVNPNLDTNTNTFTVDIEDVKGEDEDSVASGIKEAYYELLNNDGSVVEDSKTKINLDDTNKTFTLSNISTIDDLTNYRLTVVDYAGNTFRDTLDNTLRKEDEFGTIHVNILDNETQEQVVYQYGEIKYEIRNEKGRLFSAADKLPYGTYTITINYNSPSFLSADNETEKTVVIDENNKEHEVNFMTTVLETSIVHFNIQLFPGSRATSINSIELVSQRDPSVRFEVNISEFSGFIFASAQVPYGDYKVEIDTDSSLAVYDLENVTSTLYNVNKPEMTIPVRFIQNPHGNLKIRLNKPSDVDLSEDNVVVYSINSRSELNSEFYNVIPYGSYLVYMEGLPSNMKVVPDHLQVEINSEAETIAELTVVEREDRDYTAIKPIVKMEDGSDPIDVNFKVEVLGYENEEISLDRVPNGGRAVITLTDFDRLRYTADVETERLNTPDSVSAIVDLSDPDNVIQPVFVIKKIEFKRGVDVNVKLDTDWSLNGPFYVGDAHDYVDEHYGGNLTFTITNLDTNEVVEKEVEVGGYNFETFPLKEGIYKIEAKDLDDHLSQPNEFVVTITKDMEQTFYKFVLVKVPMLFVPTYEDSMYEKNSNIDSTKEKVGRKATIIDAGNSDEELGVRISDIDEDFSELLKKDANLANDPIVTKVNTNDADKTGMLATKVRIINLDTEEEVLEKEDVSVFIRYDLTLDSRDDLKNYVAFKIEDTKTVSNMITSLSTMRPFNTLSNKKFTKLSADKLSVYGDNKLALKVDKTGDYLIVGPKLYTPKEFEVTFTNDEQSNVVKVMEGEKVAPQDTPTKQGYEFVGWYFNDEKFDFDSVVSENMTLNAKWRADKKALTSLVMDLKDLKESVEELNADEKYKMEFVKAYASANAVLSDDDATKEDVEQAISDLETARDNMLASIKDETPSENDGNKNVVDEPITLPVVKDKPFSDSKTDGSLQEVPKTGVEDHQGAYILLMLSSILGLVVLRKRKS